MTAPQSIVRPAGEGPAVTLGPNHVCFLLSRDDTDCRFSLTEWTMAPPPAPGPPLHIHADADETCYVLAGAIEFRVGAQAHLTAPGAVVLVPKGTPHTLVNRGPGPARFLVILAPPGFERYWQEAAQLLATSQGAPDPDQMRALQQAYHMDTGGQARQFSPDASAP